MVHCVSGLSSVDVPDLCLLVFVLREYAFSSSFRERTVVVISGLGRKVRLSVFCHLRFTCPFLSFCLCTVLLLHLSWLEVVFCWRLSIVLDPLKGKKRGGLLGPHTNDKV